MDNPPYTVGREKNGNHNELLQAY